MNAIKVVRKKEDVYEAIQLKKDNLKEVSDFLGYVPKVQSARFVKLDPDSDIGDYLGIFINTIYGDRYVGVGDYILKQFGCAFWPYAEDDFKEHFRVVPDTGMNFGDAVKALRQGKAIYRKGWNGGGVFVIKQVPAHIESEIIPKMQSLPQSAKDLILKGKGFIDYENQCLIYNENTGRADSWVPSISDVFAENWEVME